MIYTQIHRKSITYGMGCSELFFPTCLSPFLVDISTISLTSNQHPSSPVNSKSPMAGCMRDFLDPKPNVTTATMVDIVYTNRQIKT